MKVHDDVEVFSAFTRTWTQGFQVAQLVPGGYRLRRASDGSDLPTVTGEADIRLVVPHI